MKAPLKQAALVSGALLGAMVLALAALSLSWTYDEGAPEAASGHRRIALTRASTAMVVAAHPRATEAGLQILKEGGNAMDAAVAVQAVLTLVEPQSSGIGGGAFILYYDAGRKKLYAYDGRETAPARATPRQFLGADSAAMPMWQAIVGGRSVGVPGVLRALELAQSRHGQLRWGPLFEPAITLSAEGFEVTPRLNQLLRADVLLRTQPVARGYFYDDRGRARPVGYRLRNPALAQTFKRIARGGADAFYRGELARDMVAAVAKAKSPTPAEVFINKTLLDWGAPYGGGFVAKEPNPGSLGEDDLAQYQARERAPLCQAYRVWKICSLGPPSSGGVAVLQVLALLERFGPVQEVNAAASLHRLAEAERLAYADRERYVGDSDFVAVPLAGLLDAAYLKTRGALIQPGRSMGRAAPGRPPGFEARAQARSPERASTSHFSIVDARGNVVSMTTSIENAFGSQLMVGGFLLNNQLTDFSFDPGPQNAPVANALAPGKRPRSSMAPVIVFEAKTAKPVLVLGSPGGSRIIGYVARSLLAMLDGGLDPQQAVALPHVLNRNGATELEDSGWAPGEREALTTALTALGHEVKTAEMSSGLHAIAITAKGLLGGVDPRREGLAAGW